MPKVWDCSAIHILTDWIIYFEDITWYLQLSFFEDEDYEVWFLQGDKNAKTCPLLYALKIILC